MKKISVVLLAMFCVVNMSTFLTGCKDAHTHAFDKQVASETYLAQEATCLEREKYYYSCSCGEKGTETFEIGDALGHSFSEYIFDNNVTCTQDGTLTATCDRCGAKDTVTLAGSKLEHKYENGTCVYCGRIHLSEGLAYTLVTDKLGDYYEVSGIGTCTEKDISIPETHNDLPVKSIGIEAFLDCGNLERITLPSSITSIGDGAFLNCFGLTKVNFLGTIDQWAEIEFEEGVDEGSPFSNPTQLAHDLYVNDKLVTEVELTTAAKVSAYAFAFCESLISVTIENDLTSIGNGAFASCYNLTSITMPETVTSIGNIAFYNCIRLAGIIIPDSITSIGDRAFYGCSKLISITICKNVTYIGNDAFVGCTKLIEVINNSSLNITKGSSADGHIAYYALNVKRGGKTDIVKKDGYLFYTYSNVNYLLGYVGVDVELTLPNDYNGENYEIYKYAFIYFDNLREIIIPDSVTFIGDSAFIYCSNLISVIIGNKVTSIEDGTFVYCYNLTNIIIGNSVKYIASYAFLGCDNLTSVTFENPNGWFVTQDVSSVSGGDLTLTNPEQNATLLLTYAHFYWKRK